MVLSREIQEANFDILKGDMKAQITPATDAFFPSNCFNTDLLKTSLLLKYVA